MMSEYSALETAARLLDRASEQISSVGRALDDARKLVSSNDCGAAQSAHTDMVMHAEDDSYLRSAPSDKEMMTIARKLIAYRKARDEALKLPHLFVDPAWEILLDLFIAGGRKKRVGVSNTCANMAIPESTALRYLKALEDYALIEISPTGPESDDVYVALSRGTRNSMINILSNQGGF